MEHSYSFEIQGSDAQQVEHRAKTVATEYFGHEEYNLSIWCEADKSFARGTTGLTAHCQARAF